MRFKQWAVPMAGLLALASCGSSGSTSEAIDAGALADANTDGVEITLVAHDSFFVSDEVFEQFTDETGITVNLVAGGDAGEVVSRAVLTAGEPEADVMYGIDNTFLQRGLDANLFVPYDSPALETVSDDLIIDNGHNLTPINFGDVCVNYWVDGVPNGEPPTSLQDLTDPTYAGSFVTEHPESSSPGFAFLLATISEFGEDGWEDYWQQLADGGITIRSGWSEAYYEDFAAGGGDKSLVTSYATSPVAEVLFADPPVDTPPTGVVTNGCFRQIEFAGILAGTEQPEAAAKLVDFMLSETFQADIPLNMFVFPANQNVTLPTEFTDFAPKVDNPHTLDPAEIEAHRSEWTERWDEIVLR